MLVVIAKVEVCVKADGDDELIPRDTWMSCCILESVVEGE